MDRPIIYPGQIPLETDLLNTNRNTMLAIAKVAAALFGATTFATGLAVTPDSPASMRVAVAPGDIYALSNLDTSAYSSLSADTAHQVVKQGINLDTTFLTLTAPGTAGQSLNYLIQAALSEADTGAVVLPYYNSSNPAAAYSGPNNSGSSQATKRAVTVALQAKAGAAAATGTQATPAPDSGFIGLYVVTVANGQTTITAGNISAYPGAPVIPSAGLLVAGLQNSSFNIAAAGGSADAIVANFSPAVTVLSNGMTLYVRAASVNTSTTPTLQANSTAAKTIVKGAGSPLSAGDIAGGGHWIEVQYDGTLDKWVLLNPATGVTQAASALAFSNLAMSATGASASVSVTSAELLLRGSDGSARLLTNVNLTLNTSATGANGLDTGALAASTWYSVWVIHNGTTAAVLMSLSATAPTMPSGYTHKARVGWIRTDGTANKWPLSFVQSGRRWSYKPAAGSNVAAYPVVASGASSGRQSVSLTNTVPSTAAAANIGVSGRGTAANSDCTLYVTDTAAQFANAFSYVLVNVMAPLVSGPSQVWWSSGDSLNTLQVMGWEDSL